jgi:hypothetical protein
VLLSVLALSGCGDPCKRACRHVFEDCGLSTPASERSCEQACEQPDEAPVCAHPTARADCFSLSSCEELKAGVAAERCAQACD